MSPLLLALTAGALLAFSLPPFNQEWLGWFALAPLFVAADRRRPLEACGLALLAGLVCGMIHVGWHRETHALHFAYLPFLWLAMLFSAVTVAATEARKAHLGARASRPHRNGTRWVLFVAAVGVVAEWLTTVSPLPLNLALCQYRTLPVLQIASFTGIWGVSFLLWWLNAAVADAVLSRREAPGGRSGQSLPAVRPGGAPEISPGPGPGDQGCRIPPAPEGRQVFAGQPTKSSKLAPPSRTPDHAPAALWGSFLQPLGLGLAMLALAFGYGSLVLGRIKNQPAPSLRVAAIQDQSAAETAPFLQPAALEAPEADREEMTRRAAAQGAKLVVWSEGCLGAAFAPNDAADPTAELASELKTHLVVGYSDSARPRPFNCAAIVAPDGRVMGVHHKIHLFFGERQAVQGGREAKAFDTELGKVGVEICYDNCYTGVTRRIARDRARLIAMPNFDPPTPRGILHQLHGAVLPFRAVENHVPFVRADPNGLSQIVDASGRILAQSPLFVPDTLLADLPLGDGRGTFFTRLGDWFAYLCLLVTAFCCLAGIQSGRTMSRAKAKSIAGADDTAGRSVSR